MIDLSCMRAGRLISARRAGISAADGLWLEQHLATCSRCAREAALLSSVVAIASSVEPELSAPARAHAVRSALDGRAKAAVAPGRERAHGWAWGAGLGLAIAATAVAMLVLSTQREPPAPRAAVVPAASPAVGTPAVPAAPSGDAARLQAGQRVKIRTRTQVALDHASVELAPLSEAQWNASTHELSLVEGELLAEVDPAAHRPFAVVARDFRVEVLGTRFEVTQSSVVVLRGRVRVVTPDGEERAVLLAGQRYDHVTGEAGVAPRGGRANVGQLLTQARDALAAGQLERAQRSIEAALLKRPRGATRAEALTLRAELLSALGDRAQAIAVYLVVAERFRAHGAGENALFAAARLERSERAARALLTRYLERYPRGRFVVEAKARLDRSAP
jgi:ferric-dicitrate binding protein FerR (iron transport regulator)